MPPAAGRAAGNAAKGRKPKLTSDCAGAIQRAAGAVGSGLQRERRYREEASALKRRPSLRVALS